MILETLSVMVGNDAYRSDDKDDHIPPPTQAVQFGHVTLMAAAVPSALLGKGKRLNNVSAISKSRTVMFSPKDLVLRFAFPPGQVGGYLARTEKEGAFTRALGLNGQPGTFGDRRFKMNGNGHSDYWSDRRVARQLARTLGAALPHEAIENSVDEYATADPYVEAPHKTPTYDLHDSNLG